MSRKVRWIGAYRLWSPGIYHLGVSITFKHEDSSLCFLLSVGRWVVIIGRHFVPEENNA